MDLGGASTQIVFVPKGFIDDEFSAENENIYGIKIYGVIYPIYSKSYLCWGTNEFKRLYQSQIIRVKILLYSFLKSLYLTLKINF